MSRSLAQKDFHEFNADMEIALGALAMYGPEEACEYLYDAVDLDVTPDQLERHRKRFPEKYQELQEKLAPKIEAKTVTGIRSSMSQLSAPIDLAIERAHQMLKDGRGDPAKIARELEDVRSKQKDTMMALQGRPSVVKEVRNLDEILRALSAISPDLVIDDAEVVEPKALNGGG